MKAIAFKRNLVMGLIALLIGVFLATNVTETNAGGGDVLFYDDFEDGTLNKWNIIVGPWEVITEGSNHVAHSPASTIPNRRFVSIQTVAENIIITAKAKGNVLYGGDGCADIAIGFYSNSGGTSFWEVNLGQGDGGNRLVIVRYENMVGTSVAINNSIISSNNIWYNVKIMLENNDIYAKRWQVDQGEPTDWQISYAGATPYGNHLLLGGLYGHQWEAFWFDDMMVTAVENQPPTAVIDTILPQYTETGFPILFRGHGEDPDGSIQAYEWVRNPEGNVLSTDSEFVTSLPVSSLGWNIIVFKVQDDDGDWSESDTRDMKIYPEGTLDTTWTFPPGDYLWMGRRYNFSFYAHNQRTDPFEFFDVLYGLVGTDLTGVPGFEQSARLYAPPHPNSYDDYNWGDTILYQMYPNEQGTFRFSVRTHWDWIPPWDISRIISMILTFLPEIGSAWAELENLQLAVDVWKATGDLIAVIEAAEQIEEISNIGLHYHAHVEYTGLANSAMETSYSTEYVVPMDKLALWIDNVIVSLGAGLITVVPAPFCLNLIIQAGMLIVNQFVYVAAHDPDSNYTELVTPQFYFPPQLDSIPNEVARAAAYDVFRGVAYAEALKNSFAKYQGALLDENEEWAAKQLSSVALYSHLTSQTLRFLPSFLDTLIVQPTQGQIDSMKNSFATQGLPDLEESILAQYGFTQGAMDSMAAQYVALPNDYYLQAHQLPGLFQHAIGYLDSLSNYFPELPGNAKIADLGTNPDTLSVNNPPPVLNCWVEFPPDSDLTDHQIISAVLNDTVEASYISPTPDDYDGDGIDDIAMQFDPTMLIPMLHQGQQLLSVLGDIVLPSTDTVLYSGAGLVVVFMRGDVTGDGIIDLGDVVYLISYLYRNGPAPYPVVAGDCNCDGIVNLGDVVYLISYLYRGGPPPSC